MRRIAIIGAGIAGLLTAHGLRRAGHQVTVFSDRTPEQLLAARPTGAAGRFDSALAYERELGLNHWDARAPKIAGGQLVYCPRPGNQLATLTGRQRKPSLAIDIRLQSHRWMRDLEARGGRVAIEAVSVARLDEIAAAHDLTIVATGKGELASLFERDPERSVYTEPKRNVAMVIVAGPSLQREGMPFIGVKNNILEGIGEAVWMPYFHRDLGPCWNMVFEAIPGGPMDVFGQVKSGAEALAAASRVIETLTPWDADWARGMRLADENGWLAGRITPTVRKPVGRLPSGRVVTCVGDTAMHFDPLAAQGANNGTKMARHMVRRVGERGDLPFDAAWMTETFEQFWAQEGRPAYELTNLLLEPMTGAGRLMLVAQYGSNGMGCDGRQALADMFADGFAEPEALVPRLVDVAAARETIRETTGMGWVRAVATGVMGILWGQIRQKFGRSPGHPPERLAARPMPALGS